MTQENEEFASQRSDAIQEAGKGELKKFGGSKQITDSRYWQRYYVSFPLSYPPLPSIGKSPTEVTGTSRSPTAGTGSGTALIFPSLIPLLSGIGKSPTVVIGSKQITDSR
jgi:hypothetical protein